MQLSIDAKAKGLYFLDSEFHREISYYLSPIDGELYVVYSWCGCRKLTYLTNKIQIARHLNKLERMFNIIIPPFGAV